MGWGAGNGWFGCRDIGVVHVLLLLVRILFRNQDTFCFSFSTSTCLYRFNEGICCFILLGVPVSYRCGYRLLCIASASFGPLRVFVAGKRTARGTLVRADDTAVAMAVRRRLWMCWSREVLGLDMFRKSVGKDD